VALKSYTNTWEFFEYVSVLLASEGGLYSIYLVIMSRHGLRIIWECKVLLLYLSAIRQDMNPFRCLPRTCLTGLAN
jgi:hypothetical protein